MSRLPLIGITDCSQQAGLHAHHISGDNSAHCAANMARSLRWPFWPAATETVASDILDVQRSNLFIAFPSNIDLFPPQSPCRLRGRAHDSARSHCAQEMQRQRKGQVSSSFIVYARCPA